ncbi:flavin reductase family protein [Hongsoonwoonella zoysiae]|uniref:flavin reductase family protein n=1 Tax=Hongsoonwoonella zoysiae TaxID=2821844 RepID=UPI001FEA72F5|nr:flavin reductase family protein [Hongsoonwoonella zoysiae]
MTVMRTLRQDGTAEATGKPLDAAAFREAMSRIGAAVHVVTTDGPGGRIAATVSAVCPVTDTPPTVLLCVHREARLNAGIRKNRVLCLNTLPASAQAVSDAFAGRKGYSMEERFATASWLTLATGAPVMEGARVALDCEVTEILESGTHSVIFGHVVATSLGSAEGALIYLDRDYHKL